MKSYANAIWFVFAFCWSCIAFAQVAGPSAVPAAVPQLSGRITDQTATLTTQQKADLEQVLGDFEARKGSQLAVLMVASTAPEAIEQYALRVVEKWKLGRKKIDDGALLLIAKEDRTMRIEVGYGLEGALNDATSKRIISEIITPHFKQGDFYGGITAGVAQMIRVIDGEPLPEPQRRRDSDAKDTEGNLLLILIIAVTIGSFLRHILGRFPGALVTGAGVAFFAWFIAGTLSLALLGGLVAFFLTLIGVGMGGHGGFGGGSGGGGGGGFSGGGGGFGGGGASGKW
jgi:uncharacterized protein